MAAPQVGQAKRLFVTAGNGFPPPKDYSTEVNRFLSWMDQHPPKVVINPVIEDASDSTQEAMESCVSVCGYVWTCGRVYVCV